MSRRTVTHHLRPAQPFEATIPLTMKDSIMPAVNLGMAFIHRFTQEELGRDLSSERDALANRLMQSLCELLVMPEEGRHGYPEIIGKLYDDPKTHMVSVKVDKSSAVPFIVSHRPDFAFASLHPELGYPSDCVTKSVFASRFENPIYADRKGLSETFWAQLTFVDGGYVLMTSSHHWIADGHSLSMFLQLWFERARQYGAPAAPEDSKIVPLADALDIHDRRLLCEDKQVEMLPHEDYTVVRGTGRSILPGMPVPPRWLLLAILFCLALMKHLPSFIPVPRPESGIFFMSHAALKQLRAQCESTSDPAGPKSSMNDAVFALLWRHVSRARVGDKPHPPKVLRMTAPINMRKRLDPPLPPAWLGNATGGALPQLPVREVTQNAPLGYMAELIGKSVRQAGSDHAFHSSILFTKKQAGILDAYHDMDIPGGDVAGSNWMWLFASMENLDLGLGTFQRMRWPGGQAFGGVVVILPAYGMRDDVGSKRYPGGIELRIELEGGAMRRLKADKEFAALVDWPGK